MREFKEAQILSSKRFRRHFALEYMCRTKVVRPLEKKTGCGIRNLNANKQRHDLSIMHCEIMGEKSYQ